MRTAALSAIPVGKLGCLRFVEKSFIVVVIAPFVGCSFFV